MKICTLKLTICLLASTAIAKSISIEERCLLASPLNAKVLNQKNLNADGDRRYFEYRNFYFGINIKSDASFIGINRSEYTIEDVAFTNNGVKLAVRSNDLDFLQSDLYLLNPKSNIKYYCINSPISGIGKSGSFQHVRAAIVIPSNTKGISDIIGLVGKLPK